MAYFDRLKIKRDDDKTINPAEDESITLLRRIFQALKPLGQITGGGSNRLSVDVNSGTVTVGNITGGTLPTVTTVTTVTTTTNLTNLAPGAGTIGPVTGGGFELMKAMSRQAYNSGIRANIT